MAINTLGCGWHMLGAGPLSEGVEVDGAFRQAVAADADLLDRPRLDYGAALDRIVCRARTRGARLRLRRPERAPSTGGLEGRGRDRATTVRAAERRVPRQPRFLLELRQPVSLQAPARPR